MTCWADYYFMQAHLRGCEETLERTQLMAAWPTSPEMVENQYKLARDQSEEEKNETSQAEKEYTKDHSDS